MDEKEKATIPVADKQQDKDTEKTQYIKVLESFSSPKTMLMAARETGIERASVCRYVDTAIKRGTLFLIRFGLCAVSSHRAGYYSTDKRLVRMPLQLDLFGEKQPQEKKPTSLKNVIDEAAKVEVCERSGEVSLAYCIEKYRKGGLR